MLTQLIKKTLKIIIGTASGTKFQFNESDDTLIKLSYNPTDYSLSKSNTFSEAKIPGLASPIIQFSQGNARTLTLKLLLDTYASALPIKKDVREEYITKFDKLVDIDGELHAPPPCKVLWGSLEFVGVAESLDKEYVMFLSDGKPVRARVTLKLKEYIPLDIQVKDPPRSSPDRRKAFMVKMGDSLWKLANTAYGDPRQWRIIAEANNIDNPHPGKLVPGTHLVIPLLKS